MTPGGAPALDRRGQSAGGWGHGPELGASGWLEARLGLGRGDRSSRGRARLELPTLDLSRLDLSRLDLSRLDLSRFGLTRLGLGSLRGSLAGLSLRSLASRARGDGARGRGREIVSGAHVAALTMLVMGVLLGLVGGFLLARPSAPVRRPAPRPPVAAFVLLEDPAGRPDPQPPLVDGTPLVDPAPASPPPAAPPPRRDEAPAARRSKLPSLDSATASVAPRVASARAAILLDSRRH